MDNKYPIYVISKGRWEHRHTVKALQKLGAKFTVVVEPSELERYAMVIEREMLLCCPEDFSKLGQGSIPVRNFVWNHAKYDVGSERHWVVDDNIIKFWRAMEQVRIQVSSPTIFRCCEDFTDRYTNVPMSGMNYYMFAPDRAKYPPFYLNTRVYSCILLSNSLPESLRFWRGCYNEDTDLSIRILKAGYVTILFNAFLAQKLTTGTVKGGNMEQLYGGNDEANNKGEEWVEKRRMMAQSLIDQHPDIVTMSEKWGRPQHQVYYGGFKQRLIRKPGWDYAGVDEYGMRLIEVNE